MLFTDAIETPGELFMTDLSLSLALKLPGMEGGLKQPDFLARGGEQIGL